MHRKRSVGIDRRLAEVIAAYGLFGFGYVITATFISTMVRTAPAIQSVEPFIWLVVGLAAIPSVAFWTWIGRRLGNDVSFAIACVLEGVGVAVSVLATSAPAIVLSAALGALIPLFFNRVGIDPAVASGPLITTLNDGLSLILYFSIAILLLSFINYPATS